MTSPPRQDRSIGTRWFHRHPGAALVVIVLAGLVLIVLAGEGFARWAFRDWGPTVGGERTRFARYDELLGWAHRPGVEERFVRREFSVEVRINSHGERDREYPLERTSARRMLVLGDSFGWGYGVELFERFDELLERRHPGWEIINASVSGYGTDQELLYLRHHGLEYGPDVVLLLLYANDFANNGAAAQYHVNKPHFVLDGRELELRNVPVPPPSVTQRAAHWLGSTYLWGRVLQGAQGLIEHITPGPAIQEGGSGDTYALTRRLIAEVARTARSGGARFVLVSVPMSDERTEALRRQSSESGFPYLPLDSAFAGRDPALTFPRNGHWTAAGHELAADAMEWWLGRVGVFGPEGAAPVPPARPPDVSRP